MEWPILDRSSAQSSLEIIDKCQDNRQTTSKMYYVHYKLKYRKRQFRQILIMCNQMVTSEIRE